MLFQIHAALAATPETDDDGDGDDDSKHDLVWNHTDLGGYVEANANWALVGAATKPTGVVSLRRAALEIKQDLGPKIPAEAEMELEVEDAVSSTGSLGRVEVEEAELEWHVVGEAVEARAGLLEMPFGWINEHHHPGDFNGVERPTIDTILVPTTWRELGAGVGGETGRWRYSLYATTAFDPANFDDAGVVNGRTLGSSSPGMAIGFVGRAEVKPWRDGLVGASGYASDAGGAGDWYDGTGNSLRLSLPVFGAELDAHGSIGPFTLKTEGVYWSLPQSDDLMEADKIDGSPYFPDGSGVVPTAMIGGYVEGSVDLFGPLHVPGRLDAFGRLEHYDSQFAVPDGYTANPERTVDEGTFGLTWGPGGDVVVKADIVLRDRKLGDDELRWDAGVGWAF